MIKYILNYKLTAVLKGEFPEHAQVFQCSTA